MELRDQFSGKEKAVLDLLLQGKSNKQIALSLGVTNRTVEFHLSNIYAKLGVNSRSEAILMITKNDSEQTAGVTTDDLRESTVVNPSEVVDNDEKLQSPQRLPMKNKKTIFTALGLLVCILVIYFIFPKIRESDHNAQAETLSTETATALIPTPAPSQEQAVLVDQKNTFTQMVDSTDVQLLLNWFYIDSSRVHLDLSICNLPIPEEIKPVAIIDKRKIAISKTDGSPIEIVQRTNFGGGGGGGEEIPLEEKEACINETFDYSLKETQSAISQEDAYILDIPVGGSVTTENGEIKSIPSTTFHLQVKPTYTQPLTFATQKTADIENKTVTFKGLEVNPTSAAVFLCVYDPEGAQWLPSVNLLYQGNIIYANSAGLVGDSSSDPSQEMCYQLNYAHSFQLDAANDPQTSLSVLVTKLIKDQPERLPYELIANVQNKLAAAGIDFNYVIINHGSDIIITKKPESLTQAEALKRVQDALTENAVASDAIVFDLK